MHYCNSRKKRERIENTRNIQRHNGQKYSQTVENINAQIQEARQTSSRIKGNNHSLNAETKDTEKFKISQSEKDTLPIKEQ